MNGKTLTVIAIAVLAAVCAFGVYALISDDAPETEFGIAYETDGGVQNPFNPTSYRAGETTDLEVLPDRGDDRFGGWYLDEGLTQLCMEITPDMSGDLTVYAKWTDDPTGEHLNASGTLAMKTEEGYEYYDRELEQTTCKLNDDGRYYVHQTIRDTRDDVYSVDDFGFWSDVEKIDYKLIGEETIETMYGPRLCEVYSLKQGSSEWKSWQDKELGLEYRLAMDGGDFEQILDISRISIVEIPDTYEVTVYTDEGLKVTGAGTYSPGDKAVLTVSGGDDFKGWYDDRMNLISEDRTLEMEVEWVDETVFAMSANIYEATPENGFTVETGMSGDGLEWKLRYQDGFFVAEGTTATVGCYGLEDGYYTAVFEDGGGLRGAVFVHADVMKLNTVEFTYEGEQYTANIYVDYYQYAESLGTNPDGRHYTTDEAAASFVTYEHEGITEIAGGLASSFEGIPELVRAELMLAMIQGIEFETDEAYNGQQDYWKYPIETLYESKGDSEDTAFAYCALMKAMGFDVALLMFEDRITAGVALDGDYGSFYELDGKKYYCADTASDDSKLGTVPPGIGEPRIVAI